MDPQGKLYGVTSAGGAYGSGTVFEINTNNQESIIWDFRGERDGGNPIGVLLRDAAGNLYGATTYGGDKICSDGCGVVFEISQQ